MLGNIPAGTHPGLLGTGVMGLTASLLSPLSGRCFRWPMWGGKLTSRGIPALPGRQWVQMKWAPPHHLWWFSGKESACNAGDLKEMRVWSLGQEDPLELEMTTQSSILAWEIPWTEQPGGLQSMGSQRVGHDWAQQQQIMSKVIKRFFWSRNPTNFLLRIRLKS